MAVATVQASLEESEPASADQGLQSTELAHDQVAQHMQLVLDGKLEEADGFLSCAMSLPDYQTNARSAAQLNYASANLA
jgi:hypothetical protein